MGISKATAHYEGKIKSGKGAMKPGHASEVPFSFASRFETEQASNPEEMIGAALAGCFSMALASNIEKAGGDPQSVRTSAEVKLEKGEAGFSITSIALSTEVKASGIDQAKLNEVGEATKKGCPVSKALASVGTISANVKLV
jgi:lipoyl-dependent peroxiredoxin